MIDVRVSPLGAWRPARSCTYTRRIAPRGTQAAPHERRTAPPAVLARRRLRKLLIQAPFAEVAVPPFPPPATRFPPLTPVPPRPSTPPTPRPTIAAPICNTSVIPPPKTANDAALGGTHGLIA